MIINKSLQTKEVENAIILPANGRLGGVVDQNHILVEESLYKYGELTLWGGSYDCSENVEQIPETVIYIGWMQKHWGNFVFDCMARMWYVLQESRTYKIVYCGEHETENVLGDSSTRYGEFMRLLGIDMGRFLDIRRPTQFEKVIIPELAGFPGTFYTDGYTAVFDKAVTGAESAASIKVYDKIYLTRRQMSSCKELGEREIEAVFQSMGYHVIAPEKLSVEEQVFVFSHCRSFASIEGTTSHNIMFAPRGVEHIILRKQDYDNTRQIAFDGIKGIVPEYINVYYEPYKGFPLSHDVGPFYIGVTKSLKKWLDSHGRKLMLSEKVEILCAKIWNAFVYTLKCFYYKYWLYRA